MDRDNPTPTARDPPPPQTPLQLYSSTFGTPGSASKLATVGPHLIDAAHEGGEGLGRHVERFVRDLYLNQRAASFLPRQGYRDKSYRICRQVFHATRPKRGYYQLPAPTNSATIHDNILLGWTQDTTLSEWKNRWQQATANRRTTTASLDPAWSGKEIDKRHKGLTKAQSSLLTQARTGHIGLNAYLAQRRVPGANPACRCNAEVETFDHVVLDCPQTDRTRLPAKVPQTAAELAAALKGAQTARPLLKWFIRSGRLPEYRLAAEWDETTPSPDNIDTDTTVVH